MKKRYVRACVLSAAAIAVWAACGMWSGLSDALMLHLAAPAFRTLARFFARAPFPVAEPALFLLLLLTPVLCVKRPEAVSALLLLLALLWAPCLYRTPLRETMGLREGVYTAQDLADAIEEMAERAAPLRGAAVAKADSPEEIAADINGAAPAKTARYPEWMRAMGAAGIFIPLTGEAIVDADEPYFSLPFTMAHETAHQSGYGREDEASFIAYVSCMEGGRLARYSATVAMMRYALEALRDADGALWADTVAALPDGVKRDLYQMNAFGDARETDAYLRRRGVAEAFLRLGGQDGVRSYSGVLGLWLDARREGMIN